VGEIYVDHVLTGFNRWPELGEEVYAQNYALELGGGAAITACALARLGRSVSLIGVIGSTEKEWIDQRLADFGVSGKELRCAGQRTGITVSVSSEIDRSFFTFLGANAGLEQQLADNSLLELMEHARHVHFAMPLSVELAEKLVRQLRSPTTSLDVGHHAAWLRDPANLPTCSTIDYLLPNEKEARILSDGDAEAYLQFTRDHHWRNGVVKMGPHGAMMRSNGGNVGATAPIVQTVDTTGAGDAFNAGFIDALLDTSDEEERLRRGCVVGALSTRAPGALRALPTRKELDACLKESYV
jgi:sugar/nucleoside kinase (ribokinase family)